ncbi:UNVERIFIED_ORG: hypothetical protein B2H98_07005 [Clostridium botulinum]
MIDKMSMNLYVNKVNTNKNINEINSNNKVEEKLIQDYKDTIELNTKNDYNYSKDRKNWMSTVSGGLTPILKGMVQVSAGAFNKIQSAVLVPPLCDKVMEMGKDDRCKWVVIDGVRYETPLAENEKPVKYKTLMELLNESSKRMDERKTKEKKYEKSDIIDLGDSKAIVYGTLPKEALEMLAGIFNKQEGNIHSDNI